MLESFAAFTRSVRDIVFENAGGDLLFCFSLSHPMDASSNQAGDLFKQNGDFLLVETTIRTSGRAGVGKEAPRRVTAEVGLAWLTKEQGNDIEKHEQLELVSRWFTEQTINGVRYRQLTPVGEFPLMGFMSYEGTINCNFELRTAKR